MGSAGEGEPGERDRRCQGDSAELQGHIHGLPGLLSPGMRHDQPALPGGWLEKMRIAVVVETEVSKFDVTHLATTLKAGLSVITFAYSLNLGWIRRPGYFPRAPVLGGYVAFLSRR